MSSSSSSVSSVSFSIASSSQETTFTLNPAVIPYVSDIVPNPDGTTSYRIDVPELVNEATIQGWVSNARAAQHQARQQSESKKESDSSS